MNFKSNRPCMIHEVNGGFVGSNPVDERLCRRDVETCLRALLDISRQPGGILFAHLRDGCADKPTAAAASPAPFPMNDRHYCGNRTPGQIHRDKERASRSSQVFCGKATAYKRESHSNLADNLAMSLRAMSVSDVPGQNISLNQGDRGGQVDLVTGEAALVSCKSGPLDRSSRQFTERIKTAK